MQKYVFKIHFLSCERYRVSVTCKELWFRFLALLRKKRTLPICKIGVIQYLCSLYKMKQKAKLFKAKWLFSICRRSLIFTTFVSLSNLWHISVFIILVMTSIHKCIQLLNVFFNISQYIVWKVSFSRFFFSSLWDPVTSTVFFPIHHINFLVRMSILWEDQIRNTEEGILKA